MHDSTTRIEIGSQSTPERELPRPLRIAHLIPTGEGAVWASEMMEELAQRGHELLAIIEADNGGLARRLRAARIPYHVAPIKNVRLPLSMMNLVRILRSERIDILHTHLFYGQIFGRIAARVARVPACVSMVAGPWQLEVPLLARIDRATGWMDDATIGSSRRILDLYKRWGAPDHRQRLIYYGPRAERFDPSLADGSRLRREFGLGPATPLVGLAAYFYPPKRLQWLVPPAVRGRGLKGHEDAIRAAALVRAQIPNVRFVFVGSPWNGQRGERYLASLKNLVRELGLDQTVLFAGFRSDIANVLAAFDVALQCSLSENLGGTIESLLMERPTIATRVGGMTETVIHGRTGLLVPPQDPTALADAIVHLLNDPAMAKELGRKGRQFMLGQFTLEQTVEEIDMLYRQLAHSKGLFAESERHESSDIDVPPTCELASSHPSRGIGRQRTSVDMQSVGEIHVDNLLSRDPVELETQSIRQYVRGRTVLVTGAAGSIGSELCRQLLGYEPAHLILLDQSELGIFNLEQEFEERAPEHTILHPVLADITDQQSIEQIIAEWRPDVIFHAAAYKHVPLMEKNVQAAVRNNVLGTKVLVDLAVEYGVDRFVFVSTDKAVRPISVMGATKWLAEKYVKAASGTGRTRFVTVRFGNVLNSTGSVIPTFQRQIESGGPITVTHPEMERFFMTISEASQLVLRAGAIGNSGDILVLEMGNPVKIVDLAIKMIRQSGLRYPEDVDIVYSGVRPGEKLNEELFDPSEQEPHRAHDKILRARPTRVNPLQVAADLTWLEQTLSRESHETHRALWEIVDRSIDATQSPIRIRVAA